jgi:hypothetical protein
MNKSFGINRLGYEARAKVKLLISLLFAWVYRGVSNLTQPTHFIYFISPLFTVV